jgi:hypothetical protein
MTSMSLSGRVSEVVREYDAQGWHRTGTDTDAASASWLAERVRYLGLSADVEPFTLDRVQPATAFIEVDGRKLDGTPLFDCGYTGAEGVRGSLSLANEDGDIGLVEVPVGGDPAPFDDLRRAYRHRVIVAAIRPNGAATGPALRNAERFAEPFGPPVLQVAYEELPWLTAAATKRSEAFAVVHARRAPSRSFKVFARVPGRDQTLPPAWVMTPRSGWWNCAGERGGGIACWLEALGAVAAEPPERDVCFVASAGHELGHFGLLRFLERRPDVIAQSSGWVHLGANIGAAPEPASVVGASDDAFEQALADALAEEGIIPAVRTPRGNVPNGESREIHLAGGRYVSLVGRYQLFHQEVDRYPQAIDADAMAAISRAVCMVVRRLASRDGIQ